jgi:hypothetical protein
MRCNVDGTERPQPPDRDWVNDPEWGWVHRWQSWHTVTGTRLKRLRDDTFVVPQGPRGNEPPANPEPALVGFVGHPGLPNRAVTGEEWEGAE